MIDRELFNEAAELCRHVGEIIGSLKRFPCAVGCSLTLWGVPYAACFPRDALGNFRRIRPPLRSHCASSHWSSHSTAVAIVPEMSLI